MKKNLLDTPKLGFGLMRLPTVEGKPDEIDHEQVSRMVDMFMEAGLTYFDTAYVYGKGLSRGPLSQGELHARDQDQRLADGG